MSLYPGARPPPEALARAAARAREHGVELVASPVPTFRTTIVTTSHPADRATTMIFRTCAIAHLSHCHLVHEGRLFKCSCPAYLPAFLARTGGASGYDPARDAFDIHGAKDLAAFLFAQKPLDACRHCLGFVGKERQRRQLAKETLANPRAEPISRRTHLDPRKFVGASLRYFARRALERVDGRPRW